MAYTFKKLGALRSIVAVSTLAMMPFGAMAQENVFSPGWLLDADSSALRFQSVKNLTKVESSGFALYSGEINEDGLATIKIALDSVDTNVDLRNVRMRFLLFETFKFPEAVVTMQIDPAVVADLEEVRRKVVTMPYTITLHGVTVEKQAEIAITLLDNNKVAVSSGTPISLGLAEFDLIGGMEKLQDAAKVEIVPSATVTFDFTFDRVETVEDFQLATLETEAVAAPGAAAIEDEGDFSVAACKGRFDILSRTDSIYFTSGAARLDDRSAPLLDSIAEITKRCPELVIQIIGHTDSDGSEDNNLRLSEARAAAVRAYLQQTGIEPQRLMSIGLGEASPAFPNDTQENKAKNRRIEFVALSS